MRQYRARLDRAAISRIAIHPRTSVSLLSRLLNVPAMLRFLSGHRAGRSVWDPADDLELTLYASIFGNDFLHYGYFSDPTRDAEQLSLADLKRAMDDYASLLIARVKTDEKVLDVGCGMGGLLARLRSAGAVATGLTPNAAHAAHIRATWPTVPLLETTFEQITLPVAQPFDVVINSESFQYIALDSGMRNVRALLTPNSPTARWLLIDYFRLSEHTKNRSGHLLGEFEAALVRHRFIVAERIDITENVLPSLTYGRMLATRFALPLARFGTEKFFLRRPLLAYLFADRVRAKLANVRLDTLDPDVFCREKRYLLLTLKPA